MPISKDEWSKGRTSDHLESKIEEFLATNKGEAFSAEEIINHLYQFKAKDWAGFLLGIGSAFTVRHALNKLMEKGTVKSKIIEKKIGSEEYYTIV